MAFKIEAKANSSISATVRETAALQYCIAIRRKMNVEGTERQVLPAVSLKALKEIRQYSILKQI